MYEPEGLGERARRHRALDTGIGTGTALARNVEISIIRIIRAFSIRWACVAGARLLVARSPSGQGEMCCMRAGAFDGLARAGGPSPKSRV